MISVKILSKEMNYVKENRIEGKFIVKNPNFAAIFL